MNPYALMKIYFMIKCNEINAKLFAFTAMVGEIVSKIESNIESRTLGIRLVKVSSPVEIAGAVVQTQVQHRQDANY